jgi:hypothetical protein
LSNGVACRTAATPNAGKTRGHQADRRTPSDRRHTVPRRETGVGHLRNALQTLTLLQLSQLDEHERQALRGASARLWLALFEIQRLPETPSNSAS